MKEVRKSQKSPSMRKTATTIGRVGRTGSPSLVSSGAPRSPMILNDPQSANSTQRLAQPSRKLDHSGQVLFFHICPLVLGLAAIISTSWSLAWPGCIWYKPCNGPGAAQEQRMGREAMVLNRLNERGVPRLHSAQHRHSMSFA